MVKSRTTFGVNRGAMPSREQKLTDVLVTINPNKVFISKKNAGFDEMVQRLTVLGDFMLKKQNLLRILKFPSGGDLKANYDRIIEIDPDRRAVVEWGLVNKMLHLHLTFWIKHKTMIHVDRDMVKKVIERILKMDPNKMMINFQATGQTSFKEYIDKTVKK